MMGQQLSNALALETSMPRPPHLYRGRTRRLAHTDRAKAAQKSDAEAKTTAKSGR